MRGFTLIELLVVISIIGLLSSVVLASLSNARVKAADSAVKSQLAQMRAEAELVYDSSPNKYYTICNAGTAPRKMFEAAVNNSDKVDGTNICIAQSGTAISWCFSSGGTLVCNTGTSNGEPSGDRWAAAVLMRGGGHLCVDSRGTATEQPSRVLDNSPTRVHCI